MDPHAPERRRLAPIAATRQIRLQRHCAALGPIGPSRWDPIGRWLELRGHRFEAELLCTFGAGSLMPFHLRPDAADAPRAFATRLAARWPHPLMTDAVSPAGPGELALVQAAAVHAGICDAALAVAGPGGGQVLMGLAAGQIPTPATLGDVHRVLRGLPELTHAEGVEVATASGLAFDRRPERIVLQDRYTLRFGPDARLEAVDADSAADELWALALHPDDDALVRRLFPSTLLVAAAPAGGLTPARLDLVDRVLGGARASEGVIALVNAGMGAFEEAEARFRADPARTVPEVGRALTVLQPQLAASDLAGYRALLGACARRLLREAPATEAQQVRTLLERLFG